MLINKSSLFERSINITIKKNQKSIGVNIYPYCWNEALNEMLEHEAFEQSVNASTSYKK